MTEKSGVDFDLCRCSFGDWTTGHFGWTGSIGNKLHAGNVAARSLGIISLCCGVTLWTQCVRALAIESPFIESLFMVSINNAILEFRRCAQSCCSIVVCSIEWINLVQLCWSKGKLKFFSKMKRLPWVSRRLMMPNRNHHFFGSSERSDHQIFLKPSQI